MSSLNDFRCEVSIPLEITGQDSELCGSSAAFTCENCGPICNSCAETFRCPLISGGKHVPCEPQPPTQPQKPQYSTIPYFPIGKVANLDGGQ